MKITPLEIRQKTFEKAFRGLDKDEVYAFLTTLSQEWEKMMDENKELRIKLETTQKEVEKLREVENSLFKTLKTAEDTGANMIDQATKAAKLHMRETEMKAEAVLNDARTKAKTMLEEAEVRSRDTMEEMEDQLRNLATLYRSLENAREDLLANIKGAAQDALDKADRLNKQIKNIDIEERLMTARKNIFDKTSYKMLEVEQPEAPANFTSGWLKKEDEPEDTSVEEINDEPAAQDDAVVDQEASQEEPPAKKEKKVNGSFFDDIE
ncbi:DivIVA domain-containing protein [Fulvivirga sedimenti]|uniref:DivIVA domain-containing protein n=1 Tax=Fulvivirga sedimenti TaxID=2879465 RepID=A0A9X1KVY3_9BACT|nr:DivIVA domain-containing protein [Fulvivirga sedimenti]MCA6074150.1 DivIVA domain-containing protein [Fulvivirga sedimenti]